MESGQSERKEARAKVYVKVQYTGKGFLQRQCRVKVHGIGFIYSRRDESEIGGVLNEEPVSLGWFSVWEDLAA